MLATAVNAAGNATNTTQPEPTLYAEPSSSTNSNGIITISNPVGNTTTSTIRMTTSTTMLPPTNITSNVTNETNATVETTSTTIPEPTTTTIEETTTTIPEIVTTTLAPECGNLYQEVGEECDTTASACGAGRWQCVNCKCVQLPDETTTTTTVAPVGILGNIDISKNSDVLYIAGGVGVILLIFVLLVWKLGGKEEEKPKLK